jgi:putative endonuclease
METSPAAPARRGRRSDRLLEPAVAALGSPVAVSGAWVYVLRCADGSLYTGWTTDVERRLDRHRAGRASRYTRSRLPVELIHARPMASPGAARRAEAQIKRLTRAEKLALLGEAPARAAD